jgi:uncharacterized protein (DUF2062 family)
MVSARVSSIMARRRLSEYRSRVRSRLETAFAGEHSPQQVARSFALGVFITALPTFGTGVLAFGVIAALSEGVSKIALLASVVVLNPVAKWGVYAASFWLGIQLLGPPEGISVTSYTVSFSAAPDVVSRLLLGNLIIAVVLTIAGYAFAFRVIREMHERELSISELVTGE